MCLCCLLKNDPTDNTCMFSFLFFSQIFPNFHFFSGLYRVNRYKTMIGAFNWAFFVFLIFQVLDLTRDTDIVYEQESALVDLFMDEEFKGANFKKNFEDVMALDELWAWMEGPLIDGAFNDKYYNGEPKTENDKGYILNVMKLVGGVRVRQHRVRKDSCRSRRFIKQLDVDKFGKQGCKRTELNATCEADRNYCGVRICGCNSQGDLNGELDYGICPFDRLDQSCYSEYYTDSGGFTYEAFLIWIKSWSPIGRTVTHDSIGSVFTPRFYNNQHNNQQHPTPQTLPQPNRYVLSQLNSTLYPAIALIGKTGGNFGTVGYYEDLPATNRSQAKALLSTMKNEMWVDVQTRAVAVTFQVYNTMTRYLTVARFTFEIEHSGRIFSRGEFFTFPLILYGSSGSSTLRLFLEILMCFVGFFFVQREVRKISRQGPAFYFCKRKSTIIEVVSISYVLTFFVYYFIVNVKLQSLSSRFHVLQPFYTDIYDTAVQFQSVVFIGGFWFLVASIKFLKYLSISKQAVLLLRTVTEAKSLLLSFLTTMGGLLCLFSITAHFLYGSRIEDFHSLEMSLLQMLRWMIGDVDYDGLHAIRPSFTPVRTTIGL